jgi:hypothetical protein
MFSTMAWSAQYLAVGRLVVRSVTVFVSRSIPKGKSFRLQLAHLPDFEFIGRCFVVVGKLVV